MNAREYDILKSLALNSFSNQRLLAENSGHSLGSVNRSLKSLIQAGYLDEKNCPTEKARLELQAKMPKNAIILAAGFGMRMVPINTETPKAFLEVNGERLIERIIKQLHDAGIYKIYVVVGFMKEQFEYLIDDYGVELVVNPDYAVKNNLHSMGLVLQQLSNSYIVPCDIWCKKNPFSWHELYSWYMVSNQIDNESTVRVNRRNELMKVPLGDNGNTMVGICYLLEEEAKIVRQRIAEMVKNQKYDDTFWEEALYEKDRMLVQARVVPSTDVVEINTYEQLRNLDSDSCHLKSDALCAIANVLRVKTEDIVNITVLKKGMTNRSFLFNCHGKKYIMRVPGEGTDQLINRTQEAEVYHVINGKKICDQVVYISSQSGYKLSAFAENARTCNPDSLEDVTACMAFLRQFHELRLKVDHAFDIFDQIEFYQTLWGGEPSSYKDYEKTKERVLSLRPYIDEHVDERVLTHIDAVPDNFLFVRTALGEEVRLIDWEYAGMQDPHVDIAMFCIYALYNREQIDNTIDLYFPEGCNQETRIKIYCYIAACGLLWSNWCEYKRQLGVEFGEYSLRQYRYAKDYYRIAIEALGGLEKYKDE